MRSHELVLDWVETELRAGRLALGGRLPAERQLAEQLQVSRAGVREGLRILEALGIVRSGVGSGPSAGTFVVAEPGPAIGAGLRLHLATGHIHTEDVVAVRLTLEQAAAREHAASADSVQRLRELLAAMDDPDLSIDEFLALDAEFHVHLAAGSGNPLLGILMAAIREAISNYTRQRATEVTDWPALAARLRAEHAALVDAAEAADRELLLERITAHITGYYEATDSRG